MPSALVIGGADCLAADLDALGPWGGVVVGVNDAGTCFPVDCVVTLHPEHTPKWQRARKAAGLPDVTWYSHGGGERFDVEVCSPHWRWKRGSSGLLAVYVALHVIGCDRVVLAGVPIDASPNRYRPGRAWESSNRYRDAWVSLRSELTDVRSVSGWTAGLLGAPDAEWLAGIERAA